MKLFFLSLLIFVGFAVHSGSSVPIDGQLKDLELIRDVLKEQIAAERKRSEGETDSKPDEQRPEDLPPQSEEKSDGGTKSGQKDGDRTDNGSGSNNGQNGNGKGQESTKSDDSSESNEAPENDKESGKGGEKETQKQGDKGDKRPHSSEGGNGQQSHEGGNKQTGSENGHHRPGRPEDSQKGGPKFHDKDREPSGGADKQGSGKESVLEGNEKARQLLGEFISGVTTVFDEQMEKARTLLGDKEAKQAHAILENIDLALKELSPQLEAQVERFIFQVETMLEKVVEAEKLLQEGSEIGEGSSQQTPEQSTGDKKGPSEKRGGNSWQGEKMPVDLVRNPHGVVRETGRFEEAARSDHDFDDVNNGRKFNLF